MSRAQPPPSPPPPNGQPFIHATFSPLVGVRASMDVEQWISQRNNLPSFACVLAPFGARMSSTRVNVRDAKGQAFYLDGLAVRFRSLDSVEGFGQHSLNTTLAASAASAALEDSSAAPPSPGGGAGGPIKVDLPALREYGGIDSREFELYTPQYTLYRDLIASHNGAAEHETINHPIACFFVVSTKCLDPIATLTQLASQTPLPKIFDYGYLDQNFLKHFLLIHDPRNCAPNTDPEQLLQLMKRSFGLGCSLLTLSGKADDAEKQPPDIWKPFMDSYNCAVRLVQEQYTRTTPTANAGSPSAVAPPQSLSSEFIEMFPPYGYLLGKEDFARIDTFIKDFVVQSLLPHMERSIQLWNKQITDARGGLTSRVFKAGMRFLGSNTSKTQDPASATSSDQHGNLIYQSQSNEMTLRRLADFAFMLRDYQFAYERYDWLRKDFQGKPQCLKFYAGTQEMLGLCVLLTEGSSRGSVEGFLDASLEAYKQSRAFVFETRVVASYYEMLKHKHLHREASLILNRMTGEESELRSALFLEQSAFCFLACNPIMERKYAFYLVLAASRYTKCQQRVAAYRCYLDSLEIYQGRHWTLIEDHIHYALGRHSILLNDLVEGVNYMGKLMRASRQNSRQQAAYLKDFLGAYAHLASSGSPEQLEKVLPLLLPVFIDKSTIVSLSRETDSGNNNTTASDELWETLEKDIFEIGFSNVKSKHFSLNKNDSSIVTCAIGEPVYVHVEIQNPLHVAVTLKNISIRCIYGELPKNMNDFIDEDRTNIILVDKDGYTVENIPDFMLGGNERTKITITIIPKLEGQIHIAGAIYLIGGQIPTFKSFAKQMKTSTTGEFKTPRLNVTLPMPVLDVAFHSLPETLVSGEVARCVIEVTNKGNRGLKNLKVKLSHPQFFYFGSTMNMEQEPYAFFSKQDRLMDESYSIENKLSDVSICSLKLPSLEGESLDGVLDPGMTTLIPLFLRGDRMGKHQFRFVFGYQAEGKESSSNFRSFRYMVPCTVQPSLRINAFTRPSTRKLNEFTLGIEIENLQAVSSVNLEQISAVSSKWKLKPINDWKSTNYGHELKPKQTLYMYFRFARIPNTVPHADLPETVITSAIEKVIVSDANPVIKPKPLPVTASSLSTSENLSSCVGEPFKQLSFRSRSQWRVTSLQQQYGGMSPEKVRNLFSLYYSDDVDLVLFWAISGDNGSCGAVGEGTTQAPTVRRGHQYIMGINLSLQSPLQEIQAKFSGKNMEGIASKALYAATVREKKALVSSLVKSRTKEISPLRIILRSSEEYYHNFVSSGDLIIPVTVSITNSSPLHVAYFTLELLGSDMKISSLPKSIASSNFQWSGASYVSGSLQPGEERNMSVMVHFPHSGVFDLNRWKLSVRVGEEDVTEQTKKGKGFYGSQSYAQTPNLPHLVSVHAVRSIL